MKFKPTPLLLTIGIAILTALVTVKLVGSNTTTTSKQSAFERVMATNTLRCGYYMFKPMSWKDPNSGEMKGMVVDVANEIARRAGVKLEWTEEVTFGNMYEGLKTGRYDAICTPTWPDPRSARVAEFGKTWFYSGIIPIVRADETRFKSYADFNQPDARLVVQEGNSLKAQADALFPKAKQVVLAPSADSSEFDTVLLTGKADVMFCDVNRFIQSNVAHPGKLKVLNFSPIQLNPFQMAVGKAEFTLISFLNANIESLLNDNTMAAIVAKYQTTPPTFLLPAQQYENAK